MAAPTNLKIDGLDFNSIKENLKQYLKSQNKFKDYNFESSGLNVILDLLTYNTYYNSFYLNMVSNEAFLSTAQRRNSVVAGAKSLNYVPRSTTAAKLIANFNVEVVGNPNSVLIPKYTQFISSIEGLTLPFLTSEAITVFNSSGVYTANNVTLIQGVSVTETYTKDVNDINQKFVINNENVDTKTLKVRVQNSETDSTIRSFTEAESYVNLNENSLVYFLEEIEDQKYEVKFGDGIYGVQLQNDNIVILEYIVSSGPLGNDILTTYYASSVGNVTSIEATVVGGGSYGGDDRESIERIRFNAPKSYAAQNRLITSEDYVSLLLNQPNVQSALVWGGEDNDPPSYGKIFAAIQPKTGEKLTEVEKKNILDFVIKPKKILTLDVEIVDPEYIYLLIEADVKYNNNLNVLTVTNLITKITDKILEYRDDELFQFSKYFRYSKLARVIDTSDRSIMSSNVSVRLRKDVPVQLNSSASYTIDFANPINDITRGRSVNHPFAAGNKITSNEFSYNGYNTCFLEENNGIIRIYRRSGSDLIGVVANIGTLNYDTGKIILTSFAPSSFADGGTTLKLTAIPRDLDILPLRTQVISIREQDININLINDNAISVTKR